MKNCFLIQRIMVYATCALFAACGGGNGPVPTDANGQPVNCQANPGVCK